MLELACIAFLEAKYDYGRLTFASFHITSILMQNARGKKVVKE